MQRPSLAMALSAAKFPPQPVQYFPGIRTGTGTPSHGSLGSPNSALSMTPVVTPTTSNGPAAAPVNISNGQPSRVEAFERPKSLLVIAPGAGTGMNREVYQKMNDKPQFLLEVVGRSRAPYDCYPETWPHGRPAPNLVSFAQTVIRQGHIDGTDCVIVGSRGGQIVLPTIWDSRGDNSPPAVVLNGGCAMALPNQVRWPRTAVTFLLIGGQDYFRGDASVGEYIHATKSWVPANNGTTAVLYVDEMTHMPQASLLAALLPHMVDAVISWHTRRTAPFDTFKQILAALGEGGWSGRFTYTRGPDYWSPELKFGCARSQQASASPMADSVLAKKQHEAAIELTKQQEYRELWHAAAANAMGGKPKKKVSGSGVVARQASVSVAMEHLSRHAALSPSRPAALSPRMNLNPALSPRGHQRPTGSLCLPVTARHMSFDTIASSNDPGSPSALSAYSMVYHSPMSSDAGGYPQSPTAIFGCTSPVLVTRSHSMQVGLHRA